MKRNYGIDLLRIILMFMVVILHVLGQGGILKSVTMFSSQYNAAWLLESLAYCAVNCYALISGYVYIESKYKFSSLMQIIAQTFVYSFGIAVCAWIIKPEGFSLGNLLHFLFPVTQREYWYVSAYFGLFFLIPFINAAINTLSKIHTCALLALLFISFSIIPTLARTDTFSVNNGYSSFWLMLMYIVGACIRKYDFLKNISSLKAGLLYVSFILLSWGGKIFCEYITSSLLDKPQNTINLISYTSPTMIMAAIFLFAALKNAKISSAASKLIAALAPASFGVYLIHQHRYFKNLVINEKFASLANLTAPTMLVYVLLLSFAIFIVCLFIDWVRLRLFKALKIGFYAEIIENKLRTYVNTLLSKVSS